MDTEITLRLNEDLLQATVDIAYRNGYSFPELITFLLQKVAGDKYKKFEDFPIADWVRELSEGPISFMDSQVSWKERKAEYYESKK